MIDTAFWHKLTTLIAEHSIIIDRPRGSAHPRYPNVIYPLDYGYLHGTTAADGGGIDIWRGTGNHLVAIAVTIDALKKDTEIKLLLGCNPSQIEQIRQFHTTENSACLIIPRPTQ